MDGAPKYLFLLSRFLKSSISTDLTVISPKTGILKNYYNQLNIRVLIIPDIMETFAIYSRLNFNFNDLVIWNTILWTLHTRVFNMYKTNSPLTRIIHEYEIVRKTAMNEFEFWYGVLHNRIFQYV